MSDLIPLFPVNVYQSNIGDINCSDMLDRCDYYFKHYPSYTGNMLVGAQGLHDEFSEFHKDPVFARVVEFVNTSVNSYWKQLNYAAIWTPSIYQMWAVKYPENSYARMHNSSPMFFGGIFYLAEHEGTGDLIFVDPNKTLMETQPIGDDQRYSEGTIVPAKTGDLVLFPGWLNNGFTKNQSTNTRVTLQMEIGFRGQDIMHGIKR